MSKTIVAPGPASTGERRRSGRAKREPAAHKQRQEFDRTLRESGFRGTVLLKESSAEGWKHHFGEGATREVVGANHSRLRLSADSERFTWPKWSWFQRKARKWNGGSGYSRRSVFRGLANMEQSVWVPATRYRFGASHHGRIEIDHDAVCRRMNGSCFVDIEALWVKRVELMALAVAPPMALNRGEMAPLMAPPMALSETEKSSQPAGAVKDTGEGVGASLYQPIKPLSNLRSPCSPAPPGADGSLRSPAPLAREETACDSDGDGTEPPSQVFPLVAEFFAVACQEQTVEQVVSAVSGGVFQVARLGRYEHTAELLESCQEAISGSGDRRFEGNKTCAAVMFRAMETLRAKHGLNAPLGWVPVMKELEAAEQETSLVFRAREHLRWRSGEAPTDTTTPELWNEMIEARKAAGRPVDANALESLAQKMTEEKAQGRDVEEMIREHVRRLKGGP